MLAYGPYNRTFYWRNDYQFLLIALYLCIIPATVLYFRRLRSLAERLRPRAIHFQTRILAWMTLLSIIADVLHIHDPGLIHGLRESPVVAAGSPWSLYELVHDYRLNNTFNPLYWAFVGLPACASLWTLALMLQFRLALWKSQRANTHGLRTSPAQAK